MEFFCIVMLVPELLFYCNSMMPILMPTPCQRETFIHNCVHVFLIRKKLRTDHKSAWNSCLILCHTMTSRRMLLCQQQSHTNAHINPFNSWAPGHYVCDISHSGHTNKQKKRITNVFDWICLVLHIWGGSVITCDRYLAGIDEMD